MQYIGSIDDRKNFLQSKLYPFFIDNIRVEDEVGIGNFELYEYTNPTHEFLSSLSPKLGLGIFKTSYRIFAIREYTIVEPFNRYEFRFEIDGEYIDSEVFCQENNVDVVFRDECVYFITDKNLDFPSHGIMLVSNGDLLSFATSEGPSTIKLANNLYINSKIPFEVIVGEGIEIEYLSAHNNTLGENAEVNMTDMVVEKVLSVEIEENYFLTNQGLITYISNGVPKYKLMEIPYYSWNKSMGIVNISAIETQLQNQLSENMEIKGIVIFKDSIFDDGTTDYKYTRRLNWKQGESSKSFDIVLPQALIERKLFTFASAINSDGDSGHCYFKCDVRFKNRNTYTITVTPIMNGQEYTAMTDKLQCGIVIYTCANEENIHINEDYYGKYALTKLTWNENEKQKTIRIRFSGKPDGDVYAIASHIASSNPNIFFKTIVSKVSETDYNIIITPLLNGQVYTPKANAQCDVVVVAPRGNTDKYGYHGVTKLQWSKGESEKSFNVTLGPNANAEDMICVVGLYEEDQESAYCYFDTKISLYQGRTYKINVYPIVNGQRYTAMSGNMKAIAMVISKNKLQEIEADDIFKEYLSFIQQDRFNLSHIVKTKNMSLEPFSSSDARLRMDYGNDSEYFSEIKTISRRVTRELINAEYSQIRNNITLSSIGDDGLSITVTNRYSQEISVYINGRYVHEKIERTDSLGISQIKISKSILDKYDNIESIEMCVEPLFTQRYDLIENGLIMLGDMSGSNSNIHKNLIPTHSRFAIEKEIELFVDGVLIDSNFYEFSIMNGKGFIFIKKDIPENINNVTILTNMKDMYTKQYVSYTDLEDYSILDEQCKVYYKGHLIPYNKFKDLFDGKYIDTIIDNAGDTTEDRHIILYQITGNPHWNYLIDANISSLLNGFVYINGTQVTIVSTSQIYNHIKDINPDNILVTDNYPLSNYPDDILQRTMFLYEYITIGKILKLNCNEISASGSVDEIQTKYPSVVNNNVIVIDCNQTIVEQSSLNNIYDGYRVK